MFQISDTAAAQLKKIYQESGLYLRIRIKSGGCSGLRCEFSTERETEKTEKDIFFSVEGGGVVLDPLSLNFVKESALDFAQEMMVSEFVLKHPEAASSCGCGASFSL